jgi:hypothetical protein
MTGRYNSQLHAALEENGLYKEATAIQEQAITNGWSSELEIRFNQLNDQQCTIRKGIERKIRHLRTGGTPWSPQFQTFRTTIEVWSLLLRKRKGLKTSNRKIRRLLKRTTITDAYDRSIPEIEDALDEAFQALKEAKEKAPGWRNEFLVSLAQSRAAHKGTEASAELKQLRTIEQQKTVARNIKRMQGKLQRNATTQIFVTDATGRRTVTKKEDIEAACITENIARFTQSEDTPPMTEPLISELGYLADTDAAEAVLAGTFVPPPETDEYAKLLLAELRMPDNVRLNPMPTPQVSPDENRQAWARQDERTSAEPEGLSFSHYKAAAQHPEVNHFDSIMRDLPYRYGFSPTRWRNITDVEILKKAGVYDIDKMRTITLMDAAFNMNNKKLGRDVLAHAEKLGNLAREQYGSRKFHRSGIAATNKVLTMDLLRMRRQAGALCSNDAKSCYDRIVHNVAALALLRQGAPRSAVHCMFLTLQKARHKIRTAYGVSTQSYGNLDPPIQGYGQGNGCGPTGWAVISTPIINMMRTAGFGLQIVMCLSAIVIAFLCYAFVDDTDLLHTGNSVNTTGEEVLRDMRRFVNHWEGGLRATGGALRVDKSCWYLIDFRWVNNTWKYASIADIPGDIIVRDADGQRKILPRLEPSEAIETLGIFISMDGNQRAEVEKLRGKTEEFADCIRTGFVTRDEAWTALNSTIMKTLEYPMDAINLSKQQWDYIMKPLLKSTLPKAGIVRSFPRDILYSPSNFTGMGLMHPFYKQNLRHLELVLGETLRPSITAELLSAALEQLRLESGLPCSYGFRSALGHHALYQMTL